MDNKAYALLAGASSHPGGRLILGRGQAWHGMAREPGQVADTPPVSMCILF